MGGLTASAPIKAVPSRFLKSPVTTRLANKKFAFVCGLDLIQLRYLHLHPPSTKKGESGEARKPLKNQEVTSLAGILSHRLYLRRRR